jgi:hypothetical protein
MPGILPDGFLPDGIHPYSARHQYILASAGTGSGRGIPEKILLHKIPVRRPDMNEEKKRVLEMLSQNKITVEEAERLLAALDSSQDTGDVPTQKDSPKYLRVQVEPAGPKSAGDRVNIRVPMKLIRAGLKWASFIPKNAQGKIQDALTEKGIDMDFNRMKPEDLEEIIRNLDDLQVEVDGKDKVRIFCE